MRDKKIEKVYEDLLNDWYPVEEQEKECPEGEHWCPVKMKCVPIGSGMEEEIDEAIPMSAIEGNWKPIVQAFVGIHDLFERLETLGAFKDKKFGKKIKKMRDDLQKLTDAIDFEYGG